MSRIVLVLAVVLVLPATAGAQADHASHAGHAAMTAIARPTMPGQDAYGAIAEVVRLLQADPATDWTRVNLEALRQHLVDMHEVTVRAAVAQRAVPGGFVARVTGEGRTVDAIRRMTRAHAETLAQHALRASVAEVPGGVEMTVVGIDPRAEAVTRALGFIGVMTLGDHHAAHHLAIARGQPMAGHHE